MTDSTTLVAALRAAGEGTRLRLLALLAEGEQSVKDLTEILGQSQPRVSRHLKLLADAGLVARHAEGAWAYYRLADDGVSDLARWLVDRLDPADGERQRDLMRLASVRAAHQEKAAAYFAHVAPDWDKVGRLQVAEAAIEAAILHAVGARRAGLMLDLGTGTGRMLELLADHYERGIGIDASREMLSVARAKLAAAGIGHAQVRLGDLADLDTGALQADLIVIHQVLHYFDDPGRVLAGVARAMRPDGELIIVDFAPHAMEFLRTEHAHRRLGLATHQVESWARAAGLRVADVSRFPPANEGLTVCLWRITSLKDAP